MNHKLREVRLEEIAKVNCQNLSSDTSAEFRFRYISISNVVPGRILGHLKELKFAKAPTRARRVLQEGDILVSTVRPNLLGIALVGFEHRKCIASTGFAVITPEAGVESRYLFQFQSTRHW